MSFGFKQPIAKRSSFDGSSASRPARPPEVFRCLRCDLKFRTSEDLSDHMHGGHITRRPMLIFQGRECDRSRHSVVSTTDGRDWQFVSARSVRVNDRIATEEEARALLSSMTTGVIKVVLEGDDAEQEFEFLFTIANEQELAAVDDVLQDLIGSKELTFPSIGSFVDRTEQLASAHEYPSAFADYLYGVLAREKSNESGLRRSQVRGGSEQIDKAYAEKFTSAVEVLGRYDRAPARAICGLVAFHYNQFEHAMCRTQSDRVALASLRFASLLNCTLTSSESIAGAVHPELDSALSDTEIENVLWWCCIPLDGSAQAEVDEIESALNPEQSRDRLQSRDRFKLRIIAAEHYFAAGKFETGRRHMERLQNGMVADHWVTWYRKRLEGMSE